MQDEKITNQSKTTKNIAKSGAKMAVATMISRVLGLAREKAMAHFFGAGMFADVFYVAYRIPNLLRDLLAEGAFSSAFVPTLTSAKLKSKEEARGLLWSTFWLLFFITLGLSILFCLFAPLLVQVFAPSYQADVEKFRVTVNLVRIMAPYLLTASMTALFVGVLNTYKSFFIPALAPALFNIVMILSIIVGSSIIKTMGGQPVYALGLGVVLGGLIQVLMQLPFVRKEGLWFIKVKKIITDDTKLIMRKIGPSLVGFAATQINLIVTTILATSTVVGAVSWLNYAFRLFQFPVGVISVSLGGSHLVHFSDAVKNENWEEARRVMRASFDLSIVLLLPVTVLTWVLAESIIRIVFESGKFAPSDTAMTAIALKYYILGLPFYGLYKIFVPAFYALEKQKIPVICSILAISANIAFCLYATPLYGFSVLALGTTMSMAINSFVQGGILISVLGLKWTWPFTKNFGVSLLASGAIYFLADGLRLFWLVDKKEWILDIASLGGIALASGLLYIFILSLWGIFPLKRQKKQK